jgi:hypothetical protein
MLDRSWSSDDILSQLGRVVIVTGPPRTARMLAHKDVLIVDPFIAVP